MQYPILIPHSSDQHPFSLARSLDLSKFDNFTSRCSSYHHLHLTTLADHNIRSRLLASRPGILHLAYHVHAIDYLPKDNVLVVQKRGGDRGDKELAAIGVWAGVLGGGGLVLDWSV